MTYLGGNHPSRVGRYALYIANASRRALATSAAADAGRNGNTAAKLSSSRNISAAALRNASPFLRETLDRYAETNTRSSTNSAEAAGISSGEEARGNPGRSDICANSAAAGERFLTEIPQRPLNPELRHHTAGWLT